MYTRFITVAAFLLVVANVTLLIRQFGDPLPQAEAVAGVDSSYFMYQDGVALDGRGLYTYPGFGWCFPALDEDSFPRRSPLTLAVFMSAASTCPLRVSEVAVYKRLLPVFDQRGQRIIAVANRSDSAAIADSLSSWALDIPLYLRESSPLTASLTFEQIGIASANMPFKILFDSTQTAIYMRGSNNSPQSQADFERAMLRLSGLVFRGEL